MNIKFELWEDENALHIVKYSEFSLKLVENDEFVLIIDGYESKLPDVFSCANNTKFQILNNTSWWFNEDCNNVNLMGENGQSDKRGIIWSPITGTGTSFYKVRVSIKGQLSQSMENVSNVVINNENDNIYKIRCLNDGHTLSNQESQNIKSLETTSLCYDGNYTCICKFYSLQI